MTDNLLVSFYNSYNDLIFINSLLLLMSLDKFIFNFLLISIFILCCMYSKRSFKSIKFKFSMKLIIYIIRSILYILEILIL